MFYFSLILELCKVKLLKCPNFNVLYSQLLPLLPVSGYMLLNSFTASVVRNYFLSCVFRTISWQVLSGTVSCHLLSGTVSCHVLSGTNSYHALFLVTYLDCTTSCHEMALLFPIIYGKDRTSNQMVPLVLPVLSHYFRSFLVTPCRELFPDTWFLFYFRFLCCRLDRQGRILAWLRGLASCTLVNSFYIDAEESRKTGDTWTFLQVRSH